MADNIAITAGSGTTVATDDVGGAHYQKMKIYDGTPDSATEVVVGEGTKANGLRIALPTDSAVALPVGGLTAHDSADAGNPVKIGAKAISAAPTAVAANDRTDLYADLYGQQYVLTKHLNHWKVYHDIAASDAAHTDTELVAAPGAGLSLYITDLSISNASNAALVITFEEDGGGASAAQIMGTIYVAASSNLERHFVQPIKLTANLSLEFTNTGQSNASIQVCGYTAA